MSDARLANQASVVVARRALSPHWVGALLLTMTVARTDLLGARTLAPARQKARTPVAMAAPAAAPQPTLPEETPLQALSRELEQRGCAAVEGRIPLHGRIDGAVLRAARDFLTLPMGAGRVLAVNGTPFVFCLEPHYHEPGYERGPTGWHKGVTVYPAS
jgi:hypothetical protein